MQAATRFNDRRSSCRLQPDSRTGASIIFIHNIIHIIHKSTAHTVHTARLLEFQIILSSRIKEIFRHMVKMQPPFTIKTDSTPELPDDCPPLRQFIFTESLYNYASVTASTKTSRASSSDAWSALLIVNTLSTIFTFLSVDNFSFMSFAETGAHVPF